MVSEIYKNLVVGCGFKNSTCSFPFYSCLISQQNLQKYCRINIFSFIVDFYTLVNIYSRVLVSGFIENFPFERISRILSNVVVGKGYDLFWVKVIFFHQKLVRMENIWLMTIICISVRAGYQNRPFLAWSCQENGSNDSKYYAKFHNFTININSFKWISHLKIVQWDIFKKDR